MPYQPRSPVVLSCPICGCSFWNRPNTRYCSKECKRSQWRQRYSHECLHCGKVFTSEDRVSLYCSKGCASANSPLLVAAHDKLCLACDRPFVGSLLQLYCSESCKPRPYQNAKWHSFRAEYLKSNPNCAKCGQPAVECHHVIPHRGDAYLFADFASVIGLCKSCHSRATHDELIAQLANRSKPA